MVWARLDDAILDNPKIAKAGVLGFILHVAAITHCSRNLTNGFIAFAKVPALLDFSGVRTEPGNPGGHPTVNTDPLYEPHVQVPNAYDIARHLINVGLWEEAPGGYQLHDYLDYNPDAKDVLAKRDSERQRKASGRVKQGRDSQGRITYAPVSDSDSARNPEQRDSDSFPLPRVRAADVTRIPRMSAPVPDPDPVPREKEKPPVVPPLDSPKAKRGKRAETQLPADFAVTEDIEAMCREERLPDPHVVIRDFRDWAAERAVARADWKATFRRWLRDPRTLAKHGPWQSTGVRPVVPPAREDLPEAPEHELPPELPFELPRAPASRHL